MSAPAEKPLGPSEVKIKIQGDARAALRRRAAGGRHLLPVVGPVSTVGGTARVSRLHRVRLTQLLREAEGYLELGLAARALRALDRIQEPGSSKGQALYLRGEALRMLEEYAEAVPPLVAAGELMPSNIQIWLALGWCYKRLGRLDQAIQALEHAAEVDAEQAVIPYNLACYWCLARDKAKALRFLAQALDMDEQFRHLIPGEADFDLLRDDPEFQALVGLGV